MNMFFDFKSTENISSPTTPFADISYIWEYKWGFFKNPDK